MFEALLAEASLVEASLVEPSVESGSDGEPGSFDPEVALEVGLPEFPLEPEFAGLLDDQSGIDPAAEAGTDIAGEDLVLELDTEPGRQAARPEPRNTGGVPLLDPATQESSLRSGAKQTRVEPGNTTRGPLSETQAAPQIPTEPPPGIDRSILKLKSTQTDGPSPLSQSTQAQTVAGFAAVPKLTPQLQPQPELQPQPQPQPQPEPQLESVRAHPLVALRSVPVPDSVPIDLDLKKFEVRQIEVKAEPRARNLATPELSPESERVGRMVTANLKPRPAIGKATRSGPVSMPEPAVAGEVPPAGTDPKGTVGTDSESKPLWRLGLESEANPVEAAPEAVKKSIEAAATSESEPQGRKPTEPAHRADGTGTKGGSKEFPVQTPAATPRVTHDEPYTQATRSISRPQPVLPLPNSTFTMQPAHSITMLVGDAGSEVRVRLRSTGDDLALRFEAPAGIRTGLESGLGQLLDSLTRESVSVSNVAFANSSQTDPDSHPSRENHQKAPKSRTSPQDDADELLFTPEFVSDSSGTLVNMQA